jgi:hypothetical protein
MTVTEIAELLGARHLGSQWRAACPACRSAARNKRSRPLKISEGRDGRVLLRCFRCEAEIEDLADAIGVEMGDLFPTEHRDGQPPRYDVQREVLRWVAPEALDAIEELGRRWRRVLRDEERQLSETLFVLRYDGITDEQRERARAESARAEETPDVLAHLSPGRLAELCGWIEELYRDRV